MRWWVLLVAMLVVGACYGPKPAVGIQCGPGGECPSGQHCDMTFQPPLCSAADARPIDAPPDAPPQCGGDNDCTAAAPICDLTITPYPQCRGCIADTECGTDICLEYIGTCHNASNTLFVSPGAQGNCSRGSPCSIPTAMGQLANNQRVIAVADGMYTGQINIPSFFNANSLTISGIDRNPAGAMIAPANAIGLINNSAGKEVIVEGLSFSNGAGVAIDNRGSMTLSRVAAVNASSAGILSSGGGTLKIFDSRISNNAGRGINVTSTTIELRRCVIELNNNGGGELTGSAYTIENTWIVNNGSATNGLGGFRLQNAGGGVQPQVFAFNTVANNLAQTGTPAGMQCDAIAGTLDSSIFFDAGDTECSTTYSLFATTPPAGTGNVMGTPGFVDETARNYHVMPTSPVRDVANPAATQVDDIDDDLRPQGAGRDIGADELPP